jgi:hypothetical protein
MQVRDSNIELNQLTHPNKKQKQIKIFTAHIFFVLKNATEFKKYG